MNGPTKSTDELKQCGKCDGWYGLYAFPLRNKSAGERKSSCHYCIRKSKPKTLHDVATDCLSSHMRRWHNAWGEKPKSLAEFEELYGWCRETISTDMEKVATLHCRYCREPYDDDRRVTLDIIDPRRLPFYETNVTYCCGECNTSKNNKSPDEWGFWLRYKRQWEANKARLN